MVRELDDEEVIRLLRRHCTREEQRIFQKAVDHNAPLVTLVMNFHLAGKNLTEEAAVRELRRAIRMLTQTGNT